MNENLTLTPPLEVQEDTLSLTPPGSPYAPVVGQTAVERSHRYDLALAHNSPGRATIENTITTGMEDNLRASAANLKTHDIKSERREALRRAVLTGAAAPVQAVADYNAPVNVDPNVVLESSFADEYTKMVERLHRGPVIGSPEVIQMQAQAEADSATLNQIPYEDFRAMTGPFRKIIERNMIAQKELEDLQARNNKLNPVDYGANWLGSWLPVINSVAMSETLWGAILPGSNLIAERDKFWSFNDPSEAQKWLQNRIKTIEAWNPVVAIEYAQAIVSTSYEDAWVRNVFSLGGAALTAGQMTAARILSNNAKALANAQGTVRAENIAAANGDLALAGDIINAKQAMQRRDRFDLTYEMKNLPLLSNPRPIFDLNDSAMAADYRLKMSMTIEHQGGQIMEGVLSTPRVQRLDASYAPTMLDRTRERIFHEFPSVQDNVNNAQLHYSSINSSYYVEVIVTNRDGTYFKGPAHAERAMKEMGLDYQQARIVDAALLDNGMNDTMSILGRNANVNIDTARMAKAGVKGERPNTFTTAKGSTYEMHPDGTTTRNKAARPEHPGDAGPKERSKKTVYITPEDANRLAVPTGEGAVNRAYRYVDRNGSIAVISRTHEVPWVNDKNFDAIKYSTTPREGLIPFELWQEQAIRGEKSYRKWHFGNQITSVDTGLTRRTKMPTTQKEFDAMIKAQGSRWYISIVRAVDETDQMIRQLPLPTRNQNPVSAANTWLKGLLRSAEDQLSYFTRENRHVATHAPNVVMKFMVDTAKSIGQLSKESHRMLEEVLEVNKNAQTYGADGKLIRGEAYRSQGALEREWRALHGRLPTYQESLAYWTYHQLMDIDWALRNFAVHRDLARQGYSELYTFKAPHTVDGVLKDSITVPAKFVHQLPMDSKTDFAVLVLEDGKPVLHIWRDEMAGTLPKRLQEMLKTGGYKAYQVANPMDRPFGNLFDKGSGSSVHFVITKESTSKPMPMNLVDRNPGVHLIYPQEHLVKQPMVETGRGGRRINYGDRTLLGADTEVEAKRQAAALEKVKEMIRNKATDAELDAFIPKHLPRDAAFWRQQFRDFIDMDAPIVNTQSGKTTFETHQELLKRPEYQNMFSERDSEWNGFRSVDMDFMSDRDAPLMQIQNKGSTDKPLYVLEQARTVNPFVSLNRALGNSIRHHFMNDYRTGAIEQWAAQFGHLTHLGADVALKNPFHTFYNGKLDTGLGDSLSVGEIHAAINTRERIKQFVGYQTEFGKDMDHLQTRIMNQIGEGWLARKVNDHELRYIKDPIAGLRALMYHYKFGFFNPKQFFVQAQGFTHTSAVLIGAHGFQEGSAMAQRAFSAYLMHRAKDRFANPALHDALVQKAVNMGWKKEHFVEASNLLDQTGFGIIGREHALRDGVMDPSVFTTYWGKVLDAGGGFFKAGERLVREVAFYAAYQEWRKANPTKAIDQFTPGQILLRADDLSLNMTRASHSAIQEGAWRLPTQFYTFSQRIFEQFWGGRLTPKEKLAAFSAHSMIYGIPAAGGAVTLMPVYDMIRQQALLDGDGAVHNNYFKLATEGFIGWMFWHLTGKEYNFGQRYGPGFSDQLTKLFGGELSVIEAAGGAAGSFIESMAKAAYPFYGHVKAALIGSQYSFPLMWSDIQPMLKEISSYSDVYNTIAALNTQKYVSKSGNLLADDMSAMDAAAIMFGLTRRDIQDARLIEFGVKDQEAHQRKMRDRAINELKIAYEYMADGNWSKADAHFARAKTFMVVFGDMKESEIVRTMTEVHKRNQPLTIRARERFLKDGYAGQLSRRLQMLIEQGK